MLSLSYKQTNADREALALFLYCFFASRYTDFGVRRNHKRKVNSIIPDGAPSICIALGFIDRIAIGQKSLVDFADGSVATTKEVKTLSGFVVGFNGLLQILDGL